MKKILILLPIIMLLFLVGCNNIENNISIIKPLENIITKQGNYALDCSTKYYTHTNIGGSIIEESYIKTFQGNERDTLYIEGKTAKFFGSNYQVIQDDSKYLIIMRSYDISGLTEIISLNKDIGIGFDVKTLALGLSGAPVSDTYILSCQQI